jgi:predicted amidohydrolase
MCALAGAHLLLVLTVQLVSFQFIAHHLIRVRAWDNQVSVAYINHDGAERKTADVGRSSIAAVTAVLDRPGSGDLPIYVDANSSAKPSAETYTWPTRDLTCGRFSSNGVARPSRSV